MQFFCLRVAFLQFCKETVDGACIDGFDKLTGDRHGVEFNGADNVDPCSGRYGRDGFVHAFFDPATADFGCHRRVYGINEQDGVMRRGVFEQLQIGSDKRLLQADVRFGRRGFGLFIAETVGLQPFGHA